MRFTLKLLYNIVESLSWYGENVFARDRRQHERAICYRNSIRPSVRLSVTRVDQSKTVEVRIMQFSPYSSVIPLVFAD